MIPIPLKTEDTIDELIEKVKTMDSFSIFLSLILFTWILFMFTFTKEPFNAG